MLVLGVTADDKGAQLETLVCRVLEELGYTAVRPNVIGSGGNEADVTAERRSAVIGDTQVTPLMCEAKAYAGPVNMPTWQKFLGKLLIARTDDPSTIGILIALNGVNGNVAGSLAALKKSDSSLFVVEGTDLVTHAVTQRELSERDDARETVEAAFRRAPARLEAAYYSGAFYWIVFWNDEEYSIVEGHGGMLPAEDVERLRPALQATLAGTLLATDEARAEAEARHFARLAVTNMLFRGEAVRIDDSEHSEAVTALIEEPFTRVVDGRLELRPATELDAAAVSRLFLSLFENAVKVPFLSFMIGRHHQAYVERLVELLPDLQRGFTLGEDELATLLALTIPFPSVWAVLAAENPMITTHRTDSGIDDEATRAADRVALWEAVFEAIRADYTNPRLRGFLYDYLDIAELEEHEELAVKVKSGPLAKAIRIEKRTAVRQFTDDSIPESAGPVYVVVRILPGIAEPWEDGHPQPAFPLESES